MKYTRMEVDRETIRDEILQYLREHRDALVLPKPGSLMDAARYWSGQTFKAGRQLNEVISEVFQKLRSSGKMRCTDVPVSDSGQMHAYNAYYPIFVKSLILEEIAELVRAGVLAEARFKRASPHSFDFEFDFANGWVVLTEHGARFISEAQTRPYFAEQYLDLLRQVAEPDDVLKGVLVEGLACLRNHLSRASAVLLRLAAEHTLDLLIDSTMRVIQNENERNSLQSRIRRAGIKIEERAEAIFRKLESGQGLVSRPEDVTNRLRPAFHSIRDLGGRAAHESSVILIEDVRNHYILYASSVYPIAMKIIQDQKT